jgi:hypothetical protein
LPGNNTSKRRICPDFELYQQQAISSPNLSDNEDDCQPSRRVYCRSIQQRIDLERCPGYFISRQRAIQRVMVSCANPHLNPFPPERKWTCLIRRAQRGPRHRPSHNHTRWSDVDEPRRVWPRFQHSSVERTRLE